MVPAAGPVVDPVPCSGCGKLIDPLRAGHVAIFDLRFHYFCDGGPCRTAFVGDGSPRPDGFAAGFAAAMSAAEPPPERKRPDVDAPIVDAFDRPDGDAELPDPPAARDARTFVEPLPRTILTDEPVRVDVAEPRDVGGLLLIIAIVAGSLAAVLGLAGQARLVLGARLVLAAVGAGMLAGRAATTPRDPCDPHPGPLLAAPILSLVVAGWATFAADRALAAEAASLAGLIITGAAVAAWLVESARHGLLAERAFVASVLGAPGRRFTGEPPPDAPGVPTSGRAAPTAPRRDAFDIRPGEVVVVEPGETVPVDLTVVGAEIELLPWIGAATPVRRREGEAVVAGATVVRGRLRGVCTYAGPDRAFARTLLDGRRRADALAPIAQASRSLVERWAFVAAAVGGLSAVVAARAPIEIAMTVVAVHAALASVIAASIAGVHVARGILAALRRGVSYWSADAWDRAGRVTVGVFCARGTLLLGEPELAELEPHGDRYPPGEVLALAAGAERAESHPIALAVVRAARARTIRPDGVRNPTPWSGLGMTAVTSSGEPLVVGNRALLLEQRISIAAAEQRIAELEGLGRTVVLVAVGSRLVGLLGLQDGLRPGARAAVQHLLDAQIEPVLMSGDARETCEAIARSLDIDHVRPEVLPVDRAAEVRRLVEAGANVAVLGHPGSDEPALAAADVSVALGAAGATPGDHAIALASDDVRDAALSLALAHRTRVEARVGLGLAVVPALVGAIAAAFGLLPPAYAPIASLLGGTMAIMHARALERLRNPLKRVEA